MRVPESGFVELTDSGAPESCAALLPGRWTRKSASHWELFVHADGPSGSGRFWRITVGVAGSGATVPVRGFCLETSTVGWRTLQRFGQTPLPWLLDLDADRKPELIVWDSFPLSEEHATPPAPPR